MGYDKTKFKFTEIFLNSDGKTSGSAFIGVIGSLSSILGFILTMVGYVMGLPNTTEILTSIVLIIGIFTGLLITRKIVGGSPKENNEEKG